MDELTKLKSNLSCLIRLTKIELYDSLEDLKRNIENIKFYERKDSVKYVGYINQLKILNNVYIDSIINANNKLKDYCSDLEEVNKIKPTSTSFKYGEDILNRINELHNTLEQSISNLEINKLSIKKYNDAINNKKIKITSSETEYLTHEVLRNYENLKQTKFEYYTKHQSVLTKKYN